jgi:hypothetical protein
LTTKESIFLQFKKCFFISLDENLDQKEKILQISEIKKLTVSNSNLSIQSTKKNNINKA